MSTTIFDDLAAEEEAVEALLSGLPEPAWRGASAAAGWTVADVVLHLAQTEEAVPGAVTGDPPLAEFRGADSVQEAMDAMVQAGRTAPDEVFAPLADGTAPRPHPPCARPTRSARCPGWRPR